MEKLNLAISVFALGLSLYTFYFQFLRRKNCLIIRMVNIKTSNHLHSSVFVLSNAGNEQIFVRSVAYYFKLHPKASRSGRLGMPVCAEANTFPITLNSGELRQVEVWLEKLPLSESGVYYDRQDSEIGKVRDLHVIVAIDCVTLKGVNYLSFIPYGTLTIKDDKVFQSSFSGLGIDVLKKSPSVERLRTL